MSKVFLQNWKRVERKGWLWYSKSSINIVNLHTEAVARSCSVKKVFLELLQNSQENNCARVCFLNKVATLLKKRLWHRFFPVNFAKFPRTLFLTEHLRWLLLSVFSPNAGKYEPDKLWTQTRFTQWLFQVVDQIWRPVITFTFQLLPYF